ncbi:hypothetical protein [Diadegma fenestrale ichnovirus]|nr:hypothetical protein [Diadegma fenestrale ichnovirus]
MKVLLILMVAVALAQTRPEGGRKQDLDVSDVSTSFLQLLSTNRFSSRRMEYLSKVNRIMEMPTILLAIRLRDL